MKRVIISALVLLGAWSLNAQIKHGITLSGFGGLSGLKYDVTAGSPKTGFGGGFGLGYQLFFSPEWGIGTGVEFALYSAKCDVDGMDVRYMTKDMENSSFEFRSKVSKYEETQNASLLQIPLMLQFQKGDKNQFYAALGGKAGIPMSGKYKTPSMSIQNSGYFAEENYEYTTQQFMGFGAFNLPSANNELSFKTAFSLSAELGGKWELSEKFWFCAGVYLDYGLNSIADTGSLPLIEYNRQSPKDFTVNSMLNSGNAKPFTDKITPIAVGVKLRLVFGIGE